MSSFCMKSQIQADLQNRGISSDSTPHPENEGSPSNKSLLAKIDKPYLKTRLSNFKKPSWTFVKSTDGEEKSGVSITTCLLRALYNCHYFWLSCDHHKEIFYPEIAYSASFVREHWPATSGTADLIKDSEMVHRLRMCNYSWFKLIHEYSWFELKFFTKNWVDGILERGLKPQDLNKKDDLQGITYQITDKSFRVFPLFFGPTLEFWYIPFGGALNLQPLPGWHGEPATHCTWWALTVARLWAHMKRR